MLDQSPPPDYRKLIGAFNGAEQIWPLGPWRSAGAISGRRFPRDLAWNLCALCGDRCADSAGRAEILERRSAGSLCDTERGAAAAFPRGAEGEGLNRDILSSSRRRPGRQRLCFLQKFLAA